jgi:hypothetical protein
MSFLTKYYSAEERASLNPKVILDGKDHAVVRLTQATGRGVAKIAYIGVQKSGKNGVSSHSPLWEGPASPAVEKTFKEWLRKADKR